MTIARQKRQLKNEPKIQIEEEEEENTKFFFVSFHSMA